jgi:hypothetical protein
VISRRHFLLWLAGVPIASSFPFHVRNALAQAPARSAGESRSSIGELYAGEDLNYEIAFWLIKRVAQAKLGFHRGEQKGRYVATLEGETLPVFGFLARYRVDSYRSVMEEVDEGRRLRSLSFDEYVKVGKKVRRHIHTFDHQRQKWTHQTIRANGATSTEENDIPPGKRYDDFLAAAYNFRYGVYGPVERGKTYSIATFPRRDISSYEMKVLPKDVEQRHRRADKVGEAGEYLIELNMDPEVINSKAGDIEGWLSKDLYPVEGTIKDVFLFGDVRGTLVKREKKE